METRAAFPSHTFVNEQPEIVCVTREPVLTQISLDAENSACRPERGPECTPTCSPRMCSPCNPWGCRP